MAKPVTLLTKEIVKQLGDFLKSEMRNLKKVSDDFPNANTKLQFPSLTIFTGNPNHEPFMPYKLSGTEPDSRNKAKTKYVTGSVDYDLQLDFWCSSKQQRHEIWELFYQKFNPDVPTKTGLSLKLTEYHDVFCRYDITGYNFEDGESAAQRREWRVRVDVIANTKTVLEKEEFAIITPEVTLDTKNTEESDPDLEC